MSTWIDHKYVGLLSTQLDRFSKKTNNLYNFRCPFCGDSQKNKWKARGYVYDISGKLNYKCHNCGHGTNLYGLINHLDTHLAKQYKIEMFKEGHSNTIPKPVESKPMTFKPKFRQKNILDTIASKVDCLDEHHPVQSFLRSRKIPKDKWDNLYFIDNIQKLELLSPKYKDRMIGEEGRLVIPFYNKKNELVAVTCRALGDERLRYLTVKIIEDEPLIYNLNNISMDKFVYVTEGPIDSMFLPNAIAVGSSDLKKVKKYVDKFTLVYDNQPRNKQLVSVMNDMIEDNKMVIWPSNVKYKDINDMVMGGMKSREILDIIDKNTFSGLELKLAFTQWSRV